MGQYWKLVNLDKREYVDQRNVGAGAKLWEQLAAYPGTGAAMVILCAAMPEARGGGDLDLDDNWHGPERDVYGAHGGCPGPMPDDYPAIARRTIGRWAGDRIALVGDYAEDGDLPNSPVPASDIYGLCSNEWLDVSQDVARVIEHELNGRFVGSGWKDWQEAGAK